MFEVTSHGTSCLKQRRLSLPITAYDPHLKYKGFQLSKPPKKSLSYQRFEAWDEMKTEGEVLKFLIPSDIYGFRLFPTGRHAVASEQTSLEAELRWAITHLTGFDM